ncbi:MAG: hypothetical protein V4555_08920 [Acidobacteriota bacterium]
MIVRVEEVVGGYAILLSREVGKELGLHDGAAVEVHRVGHCSNDGPTVRYATAEEVMAAYEEIRPQYDVAFRELAKGPEGVGPHDPPPFDRKRW